MEKPARAKVFFTRLGKSPVCDSADGAMDQLARILNAVEDEFTNVPYNPNLWESDGRMYPPHEDSRRDSGYPGLKKYRSRRHVTWIAANGAIKIDSVGGAICLDKPGADGMTVTSLMESLSSKRSSPA